MRERINQLSVVFIASIILYYSFRPLPEPASGTGSSSAVILHFLAYFGLSAALFLNLYDREKGLFYSVLIATVFGAGIEVVQSFKAFRFFSWIDIAANTGGASLVLLDYSRFFTSQIIRLQDWSLGLFYRLVPLSLEEEEAPF